VQGKHRKLVAAVVALGLLASVGLGGCAPKQTGGEATKPATSEPKKGGSMSFYIGEPAYIDPYNAQETEGMQITQAIFDSLTNFDEKDPTKLVPAAAESWEPNADATVWTFKLDPNGKFADGTPVKASDFVYAWNRIANPKTVNTATGKRDFQVKTEGENPEHAGFAIQFVNNAKALNFDAPQPGQFSYQRRSGERVVA